MLETANATLIPYQDYVKLSDNSWVNTMARITSSTSIYNHDIGYQLLLNLRNDACIRVGALGNFCFRKGFYIYSGSARRHMDARLARHQLREKPRRWHVDYLTTHPDCELIASRRSPSDECTLNQQTKGDIVAPKFGASDCRNGCGSHLLYVGRTKPTGW